MKTVLGIFRAVLWMAIFLLPFVILFWMWFIFPHKLEKWTGWTDWVCAVLSVIAGVIAAAAYIVMVWPRLFRSSSSGPSPFAPPEPEPPTRTFVQEPLDDRQML